MKKSISIPLLCFLFSLNSFAQIIFEEGYFITNTGERTTCLIKNIDWKYNPTVFEYKLTKEATAKTATIETVKEFGMTDGEKYTRFKGEIDRSSDNLEYLSRRKQPEYSEEQVFLKHLIQGKATLFIYEEAGLVRYFYHLDNTKIQQLIHKNYLTKAEAVKQNNYYQQQLWNSLKCAKFSMEDLKRIGYKQRPLVDFFVQYNQCNNAVFTDYTKKNKKKVLNLSIRPGLENASLSINNSISTARNRVFNSRLGLRVGLEAELILPFNKNKWAVIIEPTYKNYNTYHETDFEGATVNYKSIELPIGLRHYFFLNDQSKFFVNAAYLFDFQLNSKIDFEFSRDLNIKSDGNVILGVGYNHKQKYSMELRYGIARPVLSQYSLWKSDYQHIAIILGYQLF